MTGPTVLVNLAAPWSGADGAAGEDVAVAAARLAASGADGVGLVDSPRLFADGFVGAERVLTGTGVRLAGPCVASLGLRHPATVAGAVRTLERGHPGRAFAVVGRGESSVRNEGLPAPGLSDHLAALRRFRDLLADEQGLLGSGRVLGAASGPRTIAATAGVLGGVLLDTGVDPGMVARAVAAARAERSDTAVWLFLRAVVTDSDEAAAAATAPLLGSTAMRMSAAPDWYGLAEEGRAAVRAAVRAVADAHDYARHGTAAAHTPVDGVAEDAVREAFFLTGPPERITARLRPLAALGVSGVVLAGALPGLHRRLPELTAAVRAGLAAAGPA